MNKITSVMLRGRQIARLVAVSLAFFDSATAATWYVDGSASGSNDGSSWANAWTSLSAITGVTAGDTVYISGGASGTTRTYNHTTYWSPPGGSAGSRITYQIGQDPLHNGTAIFNATVAGQTWFSGSSNVNVLGDAGDGLMHFQVTNFAVVSSNVRNFRLAYIDCSAGIPRFGDFSGPSGVNGLEVDHCSINIIDLTADHAVFAQFGGTTWDDNKFHHNTIRVPNSSNGNGADAMQFNGIGFSIYNNNIIGEVVSYTGSQHQDGWQSSGNSSFVKIYNNYFQDIANYPMFADGYAGGFSNVLIFNNLVCLGSPTIAASASPAGIVLGVDGGFIGTSPCTFTNITVADNTIVDYQSHTAIALNNVTRFAATYTNCVIADNVLLNSGIVDLAGNATSTTSNNVTLSKTQGPDHFVSYTEFFTATNDLHPLLSSTALVDMGTDLSAAYSGFFTTGKDGNSRPLGGGWDIGAYELVQTVPSILTQPAASQAVASGATVTFTVLARGQAPLTYKWKKGVTSLTNGGVVSGATSATLTLTGVTVADSATYTVEVNNALGPLVTSDNAVLNVNPVAPSITTHPIASQTLLVGATATFAGSAAGDPTPALRWRKDGVDLVNGSRVTGASSSTLTITGLVVGDSAAYTLVATNGVGSPALSDASVLTVNKGTPTITTAPTASAITLGQALSASTLSGGSASMPGQFSFAFPQQIPALGSALTIVTFTPTDTANYNTASSLVPVTVNPAGKAPSITSPSGAGGTVGTSFNYSITATEEPATFSATGLPAGLSVNSSTGLISGVPNAAGTYSLTVAASNATGSGSAAVVLTVAPATQVVTFPPPAGPIVLAQPVTLNATASSGLPVTFAVVSGNASISGNSLTIFSTGAVVVRATQGGNANTNPASADLTISNAMSPASSQVYFGKLGADDFAASFSSDGRSGTLLALISSTGEPLVANFPVAPDGSFNATLPAASAAGSGFPSTTDSERPRAAAASRTIHGRVLNGLLSGTLDELGLTFSGAVQPSVGTTTALAGTYTASATASSFGTTYLVIGTQGQAFALSVGSGLATAGTGNISAIGAFQVKTSQGATIAGTAEAVTTSVTGTVRLANGPTIGFAGLGAATARTDRLVNLSSRIQVSATDSSRVFIAGFVVSGSKPKQVLLRAVGPSLISFDVQNGISSPSLQLFNIKGEMIAQNAGWADAPDVAAAASRVGAFRLRSGSQDAALMQTLNPGSYTMIIASASGNGVVLAEVYDASVNPQAEPQKLVNISSRGFVNTGDGAMIAGFVITGNSPKRVLIRGVGPGLAAFGVSGVLADPFLTIYSQSGNTVAQNDDWDVPRPLSSAQTLATGADIVSVANDTGAFPLAAGSTDAAVLLTLVPGIYSAIVTGAGTTTGIALVEVYETP